MGSVRKDLFVDSLPEREKHHSRLFIDLAENIHIHHREFRTVFSLDEYFEYADIIERSTKDVRNFLAQNQGYEEGKYPTTILIAGGKERQLKFLENSPSPNKSKYFSDEFAIELQDEFVTDEIHVHYRDFRMALNRDHFKVIAKGFSKALERLEEFENENDYKRESHNDRLIADFNKSGIAGGCRLGGSRKVSMEQVESYWYKDIVEEWFPDEKVIGLLVKQYHEKGSFFPITLSTEDDGSHFIIDGHHRAYAARVAGAEDINAIVTDLTFEETYKLRKAEVLLKEFDIETNDKYNISHFFKNYTAFCLNRYYHNIYDGLLKRNSFFYKVMRRIKRTLLGKKYIFKRFYESHNK